MNKVPSDTKHPRVDGICGADEERTFWGIDGIPRDDMLWMFQFTDEVPGNAVYGKNDKTTQINFGIETLELKHEAYV